MPKDPDQGSFFDKLGVWLRCFCSVFRRQRWIQWRKTKVKVKVSSSNHTDQQVGVLLASMNRMQKVWHDCQNNMCREYMHSHTRTNSTSGVEKKKRTAGATHRRRTGLGLFSDRNVYIRVDVCVSGRARIGGVFLSESRLGAAWKQRTPSSGIGEPYRLKPNYRAGICHFKQQQ